MIRTLLVITILATGLTSSTWAQKKVITASYLRASIGAIDERSSVTIRGEYLLSPGMVEAAGRGLRNKGFSRFTIRDPQTGAQFDSMYCKQESDVFWQLLKTKENTAFTFHGKKGRGENREGAIFIDRLENVLLTPAAIARRVANTEPAPLPQLRITILNKETGLRTLLTNISRGESVMVDDLIITVEDESTE